ncbi:Saccharolysin [Sphaceloma murrayae]|uniref:Saccharolysin n=1 Tax=Sphaceloma murrayae TaxID=2082308 RepID=A0A2K1QGM6_9PEZI|nr:Saccharolysin [Sphaceloma murrayae]
MSSSLQPPEQVPLIFTATGCSIEADANALIERSKEVIDGLVSSVTPGTASFAEVIDVLAQLENERQLSSHILGLYSRVATDPTLRQASTRAEQRIDSFLIDIGKRTDVFRLVDAVCQKHQDDEQLTLEDRKYLIEERRRYLRNGVNLGTEDARKLVEIRKRLHVVAQDFARNLDEQEHCILLTRHDLEGVPESLLSELEAEEGELEGRLRLPLGRSEYGTTMSFASSSETRKRVFIQNLERGRRNVDLLREAVKLRLDAAKLLGYSSHSDYAVEVKMATTSASVSSFLEDIKVRVLGRVSQDIQTLLDCKRQDMKSSVEPIVLHRWDVQYYTRMLQEKDDQLDHLMVSEYFPLMTMVERMLSLFSQLLGIQVQDMRNATWWNDDMVWHEDVLAYSVWDEDEAGSDFLGYLYLDLHTRPGKGGMPYCYPLQAGYLCSDGRRHRPSTALITNFPKATKNQSSLLKHSELVVLLHELGHGIHDLVGNCKYSRYHGAETVGDFNEAPSQMLENWCWHPVGLKYLSSHHVTGDTLLDNIIESIIKSKHSLPALSLMPQLRLTLFDAAVHGLLKVEAGDVEQIYKDILDLDGLKGHDENCGFGTFRHLFFGYDAGMYGYLWSKVIAMDLFDSCFKSDPLCREMGLKYRHMVLGKGGSQDETKTLTDFLGRPQDSHAFFRDLGLE